MAVRRVLYSPLINLKICLEIALKHHLPLLCLATIIGYLPLSATAASYSFTTLTAPGAVNTDANSINASGQVAGVYSDTSNKVHGFVESNGVFTILNALGAVNGTLVNSINASGQVAGYYQDAGYIYHAYVESNGVFTTLNVPPGEVGSGAASINDRGQVTGWYYDANGNSKSFVATPTNATTPIPSAIWLFGTALAGLMGLGRRHVCIIS